MTHSPPSAATAHSNHRHMASPTYAAFTSPTGQDSFDDGDKSAAPTITISTVQHEPYSAPHLLTPVHHSASASDADAAAGASNQLYKHAARFLQRHTLLQRILKSVLTVLHVVALLYLLRTSALFVQQSNLRCVVRNAALAFTAPVSELSVSNQVMQTEQHHRSSNLHSNNNTHSNFGQQIVYWWDFGTLLGLVREKDLIFTEVDADMSMMMTSRKLLDTEYWQQQLRRHGFVKLEERDDDGKMRLWHRLGWFVDLDVWEETDEVLNSVGADDDDTNAATASAKVHADRLQMVTGRHERAVYNMPYSMYFPLQTIELPALSSAVCGDDGDQSVDVSIRLQSDGVPLAIPSAPFNVLSYWYGKRYNWPRKYDKGKDWSGDWLELLFWRHAMFGFELFISGKVIVRSVVNLVLHNVYTSLITCAVLVAYLSVVMTWRALSSAHHNDTHKTSFPRLPSATAHLVSCLPFTSGHNAITLLAALTMWSAESLDMRVPLFLGAVLPSFGVTLYYATHIDRILAKFARCCSCRHSSAYHAVAGEDAVR